MLFNHVQLISVHYRLGNSSNYPVSLKLQKRKKQINFLVRTDYKEIFTQLNIIYFFKQKRKLGPGSYEIKDFIQSSNLKPRSEKGICSNLAPRFDKGVPVC